MHKAWSSIEEVPYCFSMSSVKFQGHMALKIVEFDPNWALPDCNSSLNSPMAMKCCTKLETAKERCPIVFQGHPSNFKVTWDKTSSILTQIGRFRTIGGSQLSNPSDLPCLSKGFKFCTFWELIMLLNISSVFFTIYQYGCFFMNLLAIHLLIFNRDFVSMGKHRRNGLIIFKFGMQMSFGENWTFVFTKLFEICI